MITTFWRLYYKKLAFKKEEQQQQTNKQKIEPNLRHINKLVIFFYKNYHFRAHATEKR